jgi:hypothetical protein
VEPVRTLDFSRAKQRCKVRGIQQQAVGQGAALSAQQQLAGMNALQAQQGMMGNMAQNQVAQQAGATLGYNQASQSEQSQMLNALNQYNQNKVNMQSNINSANAGVASTTAQGQQGLMGGVLGGIGAAFGLAHGGMVPGYADGGEVQPKGPSSFVGKFMQGWNAPAGGGASPLQSMGNMNNSNLGAAQLNQGMSSLGSGLMKAAMPLSDGGKVPGKPQVMGDSLKNDTVPAMLSPGEVVIPRHVMQSNDPVNNAAAFVAAVMAKNGRRM